MRDILACPKNRSKLVHGIRPEDSHLSSTIIGVRESQQYGVSLSLENDAFDKLQKTAIAFLDESKEIIEAEF